MPLAPFDAEILITLGFLIGSAGDWPRGVALAERANTLNSDAAIGFYQSTHYYDDYLKGDYEHALEFRRLHPDQQVLYAYIEYIGMPRASRAGTVCGTCPIRTSAR